MTRRFNGLKPSELTLEQKQLYEAIINGPRSKGPRTFPLVDDRGYLQGPFNAMLLSPAVGTALQELGGKVRYSENLAPLEREVAVLTVATHANSDYELAIHGDAAKNLGLSESDIDNICNGNTAPIDSPSLTLVWEVVREMCQTGGLSDEIHKRAGIMFSEAAIFDLVVIVGYYQILAMAMNVFGHASG